MTSSAGLVVFSAAAVGLAVLGWLAKEDRLHSLGMASLAGNAVIACYVRMEAAGAWSWTWYAVAIAATWYGCLHVKLVADPRWPRRERRALAALFAREPWWRPPLAWSWWASSPRARHDAARGGYVVPPAPAVWC